MHGLFLFFFHFFSFFFLFPHLTGKFQMIISNGQLLNCLPLFICSSLSFFTAVFVFLNLLSGNGCTSMGGGVSYWKFTGFLWWCHVYLVLRDPHSLA